MKTRNRQQMNKQAFAHGISHRAIDDCQNIHIALRPQSTRDRRSVQIDGPEMLAENFLGNCQSRSGFRRNFRCCSPHAISDRDHPNIMIEGPLLQPQRKLFIVAVVKSKSMDLARSPKRAGSKSF